MRRTSVARACLTPQLPRSSLKVFSDKCPRVLNMLFLNLFTPLSLRLAHLAASHMRRAGRHPCYHKRCRKVCLKGSREPFPMLSMILETKSIRTTGTEAVTGFAVWYFARCSTSRGGNEVYKREEKLILLQFPNSLLATC